MVVGWCVRIEYPKSGLAVGRRKIRKHTGYRRFLFYDSQLKLANKSILNYYFCSVDDPQL
jgi:hypothetical protein